MKTHFLFFFLLTGIGSLAQETITRANGKKIVLNENGTWAYAEPGTGQNFGSSKACADYISTFTDKVTGKSNTSGLKKLIISDDGGKTGFGIIMMNSRDGKSLILSIQAVGSGTGCIDDGSTISILFREGSRLELTNEASFNCDGMPQCISAASSVAGITWGNWLQKA